MTVRIKSPGILLILAADLVYSDLGCHGGGIKTANIDSPAAEGVKFMQTYNLGMMLPDTTVFNDRPFIRHKPASGISLHESRSH